MASEYVTAGDTANEPGSGQFVRLGARDNFYQSAAFIPMSFALVTTVNEDGETNIGPHALCFPFSVSEPYAMLLISRGNSATANNLRRTGMCALNYVEFDRDRLQAIAALGYPGQSVAAKRSANPFTLIPSPAAADGEPGQGPLIVAEAVQVIECNWDRSAIVGPMTDQEKRHGSSRFVLTVRSILLQERLRQGCIDGTAFPSMPIFLGFRGDGQFWFAEHKPPFAVAPPKTDGSGLQAVQYLATRLDDVVRFTDDACARLAKIPRPFLTDAMLRLIGAAKSSGVTQIDASFVARMGRERAP